MTDFLYKSALSLFVLLVIYHLVLEKQKMHQFNRFYLLFSLVFSLVLPFVTFEITTEENTVQQTYKYLMQNVPIQTNTAVHSFDYRMVLLWSFYGVITMVLLFRFVRNILKIVSEIKSNKIVPFKNANLVLLEEETPPHTFLNYIFLNNTDYQNRKIEQELYAHELIHVTQKHTLDVLLVEVLKTIFWFNPLFIFYKKAIQLNHEFLADENVVTSFNDVPFYQNLLLAHANTNSISGLTSNLNYSVTKKRFIMMTKSVSKTKILLSKVALLPLFLGLVFFVCGESIAQINKASNEVYASNQIENNSTSGWSVAVGKNENTISKMPEIRMSFGYNLAGMKVNQPALQSAMLKLSNYITNTYERPNGIDKKDEVASFSFFFKKDGSIDNIKMIDGKENKAVSELLRILKSSPKFQPSSGYGKADWKSIPVKMDFWPIDEEEVKKATIERQNLNTSVAEKEELAVAGIEKQPEYPGGILEFYKFVGKNFKTPTEASVNKIEGKVYLEFMVEKDGSLSEFKIVKDLGYGVGDEVIRVLKLSPKWTPGTQEGKPVRVLYNLPITIQNDK